jgi:hypothetical protein
MANRVHAAMNSVKDAALQSPFNGAAAEPKRKKLTSGDDPVLSLCHGRHGAIESARAQFSPSSQENRALDENVAGLCAGALARHEANACPQGWREWRAE